jgi:hypothetical protein
MKKKKNTYKVQKVEIIPPDPKERMYLLPGAVILLWILVFFTFSKSFNNEFVDWDDYTYVVDNDLVRNPRETPFKEIFSRPVSLNYHPLTILSLRFNNNKCKNCPEGISAAPFIEWNVIIHMLNTFLVFLLIYILSKKKILVAFITAALFGVHPMHVESIAWVSERKDVLYSFFFLAGLLSYLKFISIPDDKKQKFTWLALTFLLYILSCLSKAMAVVFPLVLILIRFWTYQPEGDNRVKDSIKEAFSLKTLLPLIPFFAASLLFGFLAISINHLNSFSVWHRVQYASYGFVMYIIKFFVPLNQSAFYPYPSQSGYDNGTFNTILMIMPFILLAITGLVIYSLRKTKLFFFGLGFYLITVMMVLQFVSVGAAIIAERYTYLPYVGLAFIPAMIIGDHITAKRIPLYILAGCFIVLMMFLARKQTEVWKNSETLWTPVVRLYPKLETSRSIRGIYYDKMAKRTADLKLKKEYENRALEDFKIAIASGTARADVLEGAGCIYGERGDLNNALQCINKAIVMNPRKGSAYFNRGLTFSMLNRNDEAINDYNMALVYSPQDAVRILTNRSNLFMLLGRFKEAIADFDYLISVDISNYIFYYNRGIAKQATNDISGAVSDYQKTLQLQPDDQLAKAQLEKLLMSNAAAGKKAP